MNIKINIWKLSLSFVLILFSQTAYPQDFWEQTNGPYQVEITSLAVNSLDYVFSGVFGLGIFRTTNNGITWTDASQGLGDFYILSMGANLNGHIFAATSYGLYRSTNNGDNWVEIVQGGEQPTVVTILIKDNGYIFVGTVSKGVYLSTDNGDTWTQKNIGMGNKRVRSIVSNFNGYIFAGTNDSVFRSTNNGESWVEMNTGLPGSAVVSLAVSSNNNIYAGAYRDGVYVTTDEGNNWIEVNQGLSDYEISTIVCDSNGNIFAGTENEGMFRSTDNEQVWTQINNGLNTYTSISSIAINSDDNVFAGTPVGGVFKSTDNGDNWTEKNEGLNILRLQVFDIGINLKDEIFAETAKVFLSTNEGNSWVYFNSGIPNNVSVRDLEVSFNGRLYAATGQGVFLLVENYWEQTNLLLRTNTVAVNSNDYIFAGTNNGLYLSSDDGDNWELTDLTIPVFTIWLKSNDNIFSYALGGVFRSTDNGDNWTQIPLNVVEVFCFTEALDGTIYAGTNQGIFRSDNDGDSWEQIIQGPDYTVLSIAINSSGHIFASEMDEGVFRSTDNGISWVQINEGLLSPWISSLALDSKGYLYAGGSSIEPGAVPWGGVYRSIQSTTSVQYNPDDYPDDFELYQNYPNPFNSLTNIKFGVPFPAYINLKIYDVSGREIKNLIKDKLYNSGNYKISWDGNNVSSGVYFCRLSTHNYNNSRKNFVKTIKLILLK